MAIPPGLITALTTLVSSEKVQAGAVTLLRDVYSRVVRQPAVPTNPGLVTTQPAEERVALLLSEIVTREEIAASFAVLQAELDDRHRRTFLLVGACLALQAVTLFVVLLT